jgi:ComF family protein
MVRPVSGLAAPSCGVRLATLLDALAPQRCAGCGRSGRVLCEGCVELLTDKPPPFLSGGDRAAFEYDNDVRRVMHHGKFRDCRSALRALAWLGAERLEPPAGAVVTPVPLSARRLAQRGYNQAAVVAGAFATFHRLAQAGLLSRARDTPPQSTLDRDARARNVAGAFAAAPQAGAVVWLIDDVRTTGATTAAAAEALMAAGAARVEVAVLAAVL